MPHNFFSVKVNKLQCWCSSYDSSSYSHALYVTNELANVSLIPRDASSTQNVHDILFQGQSNIIQYKRRHFEKHKKADPASVLQHDPHCKNTLNLTSCCRHPTIFAFTVSTILLFHLSVEASFKWKQTLICAHLWRSCGVILNVSSTNFHLTGSS